MLTELQPTDIKLLKTFLAVVDAGGLIAAQARHNRSLLDFGRYPFTRNALWGKGSANAGRGGFALTENGRRLYET
jgi:hypothetical protein